MEEYMTGNSIKMLAIAGAMALTCTLGGQVFAQADNNHYIEMSAPRPADSPPPVAPALGAWQKPLVITLSAGTGELFYHYPCPAGRPIARSGGFLPNPA